MRRNWAQGIATVASSRRVLDAIEPYLNRWLHRKYVYLSFRLVQVLSGHGCFCKYMDQIDRKDFRSKNDSAEHTMVVPVGPARR